VVWRSASSVVHGMGFILGDAKEMTATPEGDAVQVLGEFRKRSNTKDKKLERNPQIKSLLSKTIW
jgi:hypothetical protein